MSTILPRSLIMTMAFGADSTAIRKRSSVHLRRVKSRAMEAKPVRFPLLSRRAVVTQFVHTAEPSLRTCHPSTSWRPSADAMLSAISGSPLVREAVAKKVAKCWPRSSPSR